jgi:hypothetical protein
MYLILGLSGDPVATLVLRELLSRGRRAVIEDPSLASPTSGLRLGMRECGGAQALFEHTSANRLEGVFVRTNGRSATWGLARPFTQPEDEVAAGLLAWLTAIHREVINRYSATLWYFPNLPLLFWKRLLRRTSFQAEPSILATDSRELSLSRQCGRAKISYAPLSSGIRYLLETDNDWQDLETLQKVVPIHLIQTAPGSQWVCIVGTQVFSGNSDRALTSELKAQLIRLAALAKVPFLEVQICRKRCFVTIASINAFPTLEWFDEKTRAQIGSAIAERLTKRRVLYKPCKPNK